MPKPKIQITEAQLKQIESMAGIGLTMEQIGQVLGISERTLHRNKITDSAVMAALQRGRAVAAFQVGKSLFQNATNGDFKSIQWYEMTRCGRSGKQEVTHTGDEAQPLQITFEVAPAVGPVKINGSED